MVYEVNWDIVLGVLIALFIDVVRWYAIDRSRLRVEMGRQGKEYSENLRKVKEGDAKGYFRDNYRLFASFLSVHSQIQQTLSAEKGPDEQATIKPETRRQLRELMPGFLEAYNGLRDSGYMALLPNELGRQIYRYASYLGVFNALLQKAEETDIMGDEKLRGMWLEIPVMGGYITNGFRYIMGVDSLEVPALNK